jgi:hypothetical protein
MLYALTHENTRAQLVKLNATIYKRMAERLTRAFPRGDPHGALDRWQWVSDARLRLAHRGVPPDWTLVFRWPRLALPRRQSGARSGPSGQIIRVDRVDSLDATTVGRAYAIVGRRLTAVGAHSQGRRLQEMKGGLGR